MPKIRAEVKSNLDKLLKEIPAAFDASFSKELAVSVIDEMKKDIARGISPILGAGRFPAYKGQASSHALKKAAAKGKAGKHTRSAANALANKSYPKSVNYKYPGKKPRPVNLYLSGEFLSNLTWKARGLAEKFDIAIGFFDRLSVLKERGHREGVNGQPARPIIPQGNEYFSERIQRLIVRMFRERVKKFLSK